MLTEIIILSLFFFNDCYFLEMFLLLVYIQVVVYMLVCAPFCLDNYGYLLSFFYVFYLSFFGSLQKTYEERARQEAQLQAQAEAEAALLQVREHDMRQLEVSGILINFSSFLIFPFLLTYLSPSVSVHHQHDIVDINDIFRDLGTMVHEQGDLVGE